MDCTSKEAMSLLRDHPLVHAISGTGGSSLIASVVEIDMPWDNTQVLLYGESFRVWTAEDLTKAIELLKDACPWNKLSYVVFHLNLFYLSSFFLDLSFHGPAPVRP